MSNPQPHSYTVVRPAKDVGITYLLWLFLGTIGGHRFYLRRTGTAVTQLALALIGWGTSWLLIGFAFLAVLWVWVIVDAFLIPAMVREENHQA